VAINFPTSLDNFTNPVSGNTLDSPSHSLQHSDINDAVEALEAKLGIGASPAGSATSGYVLTAGTGGTTTWQPAGKILQVVSATTTTQVSSSSTSYADTTLSATITPSSASNKILVIVHQSTLKGTGNNSNSVNLKLLRDSTTVWTLGSQHDTNSSLQYNGVTSMAWLDSPNTTSAITYKTQFANFVAASIVYVQINSGSSPSSITLMEVKA